MNCPNTIACAFCSPSLVIVRYAIELSCDLIDEFISSYLTIAAFDRSDIIGRINIKKTRNRAKGAAASSDNTETHVVKSRAISLR